MRILTTKGEKQVKIINEIKSGIFSGTFKKTSYSQCGEDIIVDFILNSLKIKDPNYLDIGAHHPININNTYLFYTKGFNGVCIEPDPILFNEIKKKRKRDVCLNIGIGTQNKNSADFYVMSSKSLSTFSKQVAENYQNNENQKIEKVIKIPLKEINQVIKDNFYKYPNFVSLDVEGMEIDILNNFNFSEYAPEIFCIETLTYSENNKEQKIFAINKILEANGYFIYADTYINTIYVRTQTWKDR